MNISLFHHLIDNTLTPEERKELMEYVRRNTTREEFFRLFDEVWVVEKTHRYLANFKTVCMPVSWSRSIPEPMDSIPPDRIQFYKHAVTGKIKRVIFSAAAACVAAALCILATHLFIRHTYQPATFAVTAELGQRASVTLPDGTLVWLNSGSCISYDSDYGHKIRYISLNGEASFDVAKDSEHPFIVEARGITTEALGTMAQHIGLRHRQLPHHLALQRIGESKLQQRLDYSTASPTSHHRLTQHESDCDIR